MCTLYILMFLGIALAAAISLLFFR